MKMLVLFVCIFFVGFCSADEMFENKDKVMTARCRAQCLMKFHIDSVSQNCLDSQPCFTCWDLCDKLYTTEVFKPICDLKRMPLAGCQEACDFYRSHSELIEGTRTDTHFTQPLKYHFDSVENLVNLAWSYPEGNDKIEPLVYVLMAKDQMTDKWEQIDQTFYLNSTFPKNLINDASEIRITAYDSNGKIAELVYNIMEFNLGQWKPVLEAIGFATESFGEQVEASIRWPKFSTKAISKYEIEWKHADNTVDITGHLFTDKDSAVITLWPYSLYQVTVRAFSEDSQLGVIVESESLYINTTPLAPEEEASVDSFDRKARMLNLYLLIVILVLTTLLAITLVLLIRAIRRERADISNFARSGQFASTSDIKVLIDDDAPFAISYPPTKV